MGVFFRYFCEYSGLAGCLEGRRVSARAETQRNWYVKLSYAIVAVSRAPFVRLPCSSSSALMKQMGFTWKCLPTSCRQCGFHLAELSANHHGIFTKHQPSHRARKSPEVAITPEKITLLPVFFFSNNTFYWIECVVALVAGTRREWRDMKTNSHTSTHIETHTQAPDSNKAKINKPKNDSNQRRMNERGKSKSAKKWKRKMREKNPNILCARHDVLLL